jgi:uncharacterized protein YijF (DUF1287 family)
LTRLRPVLLALASGTVLTACALPPQGTSPQDIASYEAAVASLGCTLVTEPDYLALGLQTGLSRAQLLGLTQYQLSARRAVSLPEGGIKLTTGVCA